MESDPPADKHLPCLHVLEAEEPFLLSHTDFLVLCKVYMGSMSLNIPFSQTLPLAMCCAPRNDSKNNTLSTLKRVPLA